MYEMSPDALMFFVAWIVYAILQIRDMNEIEAQRRRYERLYKRQLRRMEGR